jgi:hypothetical protein
MNVAIYNGERCVVLVGEKGEPCGARAEAWCDAVEKGRPCRAPLCSRHHHVLGGLVEVLEENGQRRWRFRVLGDACPDCAALHRERRDAAA